MLDKTFESPLNNKEIKPVNLKGNQSWIFFRSTDAEAEALVIWRTQQKNRFTWKISWHWKDWGQEGKGQQKICCLNGITDLVDMNLSKFRVIVKDREDCHAAVYGGRRELNTTGSWTATIFFINCLNIDWSRMIFIVLYSLKFYVNIIFKSFSNLSFILFIWTIK